MKGVHELFQPWADKIFTNDPTVHRAIQKKLKELGEADEKNNTDKAILWRD